MEEKIKMITIDLDWLDESELSHSLKLIEKFEFDKDMFFNVSPGGNGFHITGYSDIGMTKRQVLCLRQMCGDDWRRVKLDSLPGRQTDVLFSRKEIEIMEMKK